MDQASHPLVLEILDALTDPVILIDSRKVIVRANSAAHKAWAGLTHDSPLSFTLRMPDLNEAVDQVLAQGGTQSGELLERAPVERVYHFDVTGLSQSAKRGERGIAVAGGDIEHALVGADIGGFGQLRHAEKEPDGKAGGDNDSPVHSRISSSER